MRLKDRTEGGDTNSCNLLILKYKYAFTYICVDTQTNTDMQKMMLLGQDCTFEKDNSSLLLDRF